MWSEKLGKYEIIKETGKIEASMKALKEDKDFKVYYQTMFYTTTWTGTTQPPKSMQKYAHKYIFTDKDNNILYSILTEKKDDKFIETLTLADVENEFKKQESAKKKDEKKGIGLLFPALAIIILISIAGLFMFIKKR